MKRKNKKAVKAVFDFLKKNCVKEVKSFSPIPEFKDEFKVSVTIDWYSCDGEVDCEWDILDVVTSDRLTRLFSCVGVYDDDMSSLVSDYFQGEYMNEKATTLSERLEELLVKADMVDESYYFNDYTDYDTFAEFWSFLEEDFEDETKPQPVTVRLNSSYSAVVDSVNDTVSVGCQNFPISVVEEVVNTYKTEKAKQK